MAKMLTIVDGFFDKSTPVKRDWEVFGTFRLPHTRVKKKFWRFLKELQIKERIRVTLFYAYISHPQPHIHFLAAGYSKRGKILADVSWPRWEKRWAELSGLRSGGFNVKPVYDALGAVQYVFGPKNIRGDVDSETSIYNFRLYRKINPTMEVATYKEVA